VIEILHKPAGNLSRVISIKQLPCSPSRGLFLLLGPRLKRLRPLTMMESIMTLVERQSALPASHAWHRRRPRDEQARRWSGAASGGTAPDRRLFKQLQKTLTARCVRIQYLN